MKDYLLFIDTEASGLPKNWNLPYSEVGNWPNSVQISWLIFTKDGKQVKAEDHYIKDNDFEIAESATKIHGITRAFLNEKGRWRNEVLSLLVNDLAEYDPLVVGHFMLFDFHMLGADFFRAAIDAPLKRQGTFCTMLGSRHLIKNPSVKFLSLGQLYETLFNERLENQHNAFVDASATAACFFELLKHGDITDEIVSRQQQDIILKKDPEPDKYGCFIPFLFIVSLTLLIFYL